MIYEVNQSYDPESQPSEYFTRLLSEKAELHEALLKKVVGQEVWSRQREIEELNLTSLAIDSKGLVDAIVDRIDSDDDSQPEINDAKERDYFVDAEDALMSVERTYLDGFVTMEDEPIPYLAKRNNPQLIDDHNSNKRILVRFIEFVTSNPAGDIQREWYSSTVGNRDFKLSLLAWERQNSAHNEGVELQQTTMDDEHKLLLFMALENLNDLYRRLLDTPEDELRLELSL